ncbi:MAG TPA: nitrate ABC transporter substrate-binding protein, partial [Alphaproteobacteria bacterium]|nr:nitrate ABC transporter substrate-binding protein [Alphaproteobacteria bacterium]
EKVFGVTQGWADANPHTHTRVLKALIRAAYWLDAEDGGNRMEAVRMIA